jgi:hypothetical protein
MNCKICNKIIQGNYRRKYCFDCIISKKREVNKKYRERLGDKLKKKKKEQYMSGKERICPICKVKFVRAGWAKNKYCSRKCFFINEKTSRIGKGNPAWKNAKHHQTYNKLYFDNIYKTKGLLPDEIGCEMCGVRSGTIFDRHHIIFKSEAYNNVELNNPLNIIQLCRSCHLKMHGKKSLRDELVEERGLKKLFKYKSML